MTRRIDRGQRQRIRRGCQRGEAPATIAEREGLSYRSVIRYSNTAACRQKLLQHGLHQSVRDLNRALILKTLTDQGVAVMLADLKAKRLTLDAMSIAKLIRSAQNLEAAAYTTLAKDLQRAAEHEDPELAQAVKSVEATKTARNKYSVPISPLQPRSLRWAIGRLALSISTCQEQRCLENTLQARCSP